MSLTSFLNVAKQQTARLDYDWGWGISGDGGLSSFGLNGVYHARAMKEYFWNTHRTDWPDEPITLWVNTRAASGSSLTRRINVGGAAAMSNELIMHEYSHLVVNVLVQANVSANERTEYDAIHEAGSDYFAADATGDALWGGPVPASGVDPVLDAAAGDLSELTRDLANDCKMDFIACGNANEYQVGRVLSGAVWSLRKELNEARATRLFYRALEMTPDPRNFEMVADYMIGATDNDTEKGRIRGEFMRRFVLGPPRPLHLDVGCSSGTVVVNWSDEASNEAGYEVERRIGDGELQLVARLGANVETYTDTGASCGGNSQTSYSYHVTAFSTFGSMNADTLRTVSAPVSYSPNSRSQLKASTLVVPQELRSQEPEAFETELHSVYPNPFNPVTTVSYTLKEEEHVSLVVYDVLGRKAAVLVDGIQSAGAHTVPFDASRLPSGTYFVRMETATYRQHRMMMLAK